MAGHCVIEFFFFPCSLTQGTRMGAQGGLARFIEQSCLPTTLELPEVLVEVTSNSL